MKILVFDLHKSRDKVNGFWKLTLKAFTSYKKKNYTLLLKIQIIHYVVNFKV